MFSHFLRFLKSESVFELLSSATFLIDTLCINVYTYSNSSSSSSPSSHVSRFFFLSFFIHLSKYYLYLFYWDSMKFYTCSLYLLYRYYIISIIYHPNFVLFFFCMKLLHTFTQRNYNIFVLAFPPFFWP